MSQSALITGASGGIGQALCRYFEARGWTVLAHARGKDKAMAVCEGTARVPIWGDLAKPDEVAAIAEQTKDFGAIGMLVNNAGVLTKSNEKTPSGVGLHAAVNVAAPLQLTQVLMPQLMACDNPTVVVVTSTAANLTRSNRYSDLAEPDGSSLFGHYALSKSAANALVLAMAQAYPDLRVIATEPGFVKTKMTVGNASMPSIMGLAARFVGKSPSQAAHRCFDRIFDARLPTGTVLQAGKAVNSSAKPWSSKTAMDELRDLLGKAGLVV